MVQQALLGLFLEHTPCQHHEMHPHDTLPLPLHYPKPNSIPNSHAETPIVWLNQLEICVDACANYDTASGIWVRAAKGVKNDICIESGDVSTEDDELLPEASGRDGAKSLVTCWIGLAKRPGNYCSRAISDPRSENEILDFKASSDPSTSHKLLCGICFADLIFPNPLISQIRPLIKTKQIPSPVARPDPPVSINRFSAPARELFQSLHISSISNEACIITEQSAHNEAFGRSTVAVEFNCVCL